VTDLFKDVIPSILQTKKYVIENDKQYNAFVVNRALSFHYDCVLQANEMNRYPGLPATLQYQYLLNTVRGYKRPFRKWEKRETIDDLEAVREYYNYSYEKAKEALVLLDATQIETIRKAIHKGGANDSKPRRVRGSKTS
jgi:Bacteriophage clamp loader A subunit